MHLLQLVIVVEHNVQVKLSAIVQSEYSLSSHVLTHSVVLPSLRYYPFSLHEVRHVKLLVSVVTYLSPVVHPPEVHDKKSVPSQYSSSH